MTDTKEQLIKIQTNWNNHLKSSDEVLDDLCDLGFDNTVDDYSFLTDDSIQFLIESKAEPWQVQNLLDDYDGSTNWHYLDVCNYIADSELDDQIDIILNDLISEN